MHKSNSCVNFKLFFGDLIRMTSSFKGHNDYLLYSSSKIENQQNDNSPKLVSETLIKQKIAQLNNSKITSLNNHADVSQHYFLPEPREIKKTYITPSKIIVTPSNNIIYNQGVRPKKIQQVDENKSPRMIFPSISIFKPNLGLTSSRHLSTRSQLLAGSKDISTNLSSEEISETLLDSVTYEMKKVRNDTNKKLQLLFTGPHNDVSIDLSIIKKNSSNQSLSEGLLKIPIQTSEQERKKSLNPNEMKPVDSLTSISLNISKPQLIVTPYNSNYAQSLLVLPEENLIINSNLKVPSFRSFNDIYNQSKALKQPQHSQVPLIEEILKEENMHRMEVANNNKSRQDHWRSLKKNESSRTLLQKELEFNRIQADTLAKTGDLEERIVTLPYLKMQQETRKKLKKMPKIRIYQRIGINFLIISTQFLNLLHILNS